MAYKLDFVKNPVAKPVGMPHGVDFWKPPVVPKAPVECAEKPKKAPEEAKAPEGEWECNFCGKLTRTEVGMKRHIARSHKDEVKGAA